MPTAEESLRHYQSKMGSPLGLLFHHLWQECALLHGQWGQYVDLYGTDARSFELMNHAARDFFQVAQNALWQSILLHVSRFTDPAVMNKKRNLSLFALLDFQATMPTIDLKSLVASVESEALFARDWRNRLIAHRDYDIACGASPLPLAHASRDQVNRALAAIANAVKVVEVHFTGATTHFTTDLYSEGARSLMVVIDLGLRAEQEEKERALKTAH